MSATGLFLIRQTFLTFVTHPLVFDKSACVGGIWFRLGVTRWQQMQFHHFVERSQLVYTHDQAKHCTQGYAGLGLLGQEMFRD